MRRHPVSFRSALAAVFGVSIIGVGTLVGGSSDSIPPLISAANSLIAMDPVADLESAPASPVEPIPAAASAVEPLRPQPAAAGHEPSTSASRNVVITGAEILLRDSLHLVAGRRLGLITNPTAVTGKGQHTIDLLHSHSEIALRALFAPEHGLRGDIDAGVRISGGIDSETGLPIRSLYGETLQPTPDMLRDIDVLLFDMLDISARTYTYIWTMTLAMETAAKEGIPFLVLDRPNPVTGRSGGPIPTLQGLRTGPKITGHFPVPFRHGMTPGEIARYANAEYRIGADLKVIPVEGWSRSDWYDTTGLPWVNPSPNIRSLEAALNFSGLGSLEATALSLGRGTAAPFTVIGAPWLNTRALLARLDGYDIPGVDFVLENFTPSGEGWMQYRGREVPGIRLRITDRDNYDPSYVSLVLLAEIYRLHPRQVGMNAMKHVLDDWTTEEIRRGISPEAIADRWETARISWETLASRYYLYD